MTKSGNESQKSKKVKTDGGNGDEAELKKK
jgi:hypothetical protein